MLHYSYSLPEVEYMRSSAVSCSEKGMEYWYTAVRVGTMHSRLSIDILCSYKNRKSYFGHDQAQQSSMAACSESSAPEAV